MFSTLNLLRSCLSILFIPILFLCPVVFIVFMTCLVSQMIASKYLNDEGETESVLNSEWAKISK